MQLDANSVLELQGIVFPIVHSLGGPDIVNDVTKPVGERFLLAAAGLQEISDLARVIGEDLSDNGQIDHLDAILAEWNEIPDAVRAVVARSPHGEGGIAPPVPDLPPVGEGA